MADLKNKNFGALLLDMQWRFVQRVSEDERHPLIESQNETLDFFAERNLPLVVIGYVWEDSEYNEIPSPIVEPLRERLESISNKVSLRRFDPRDGSSDNAFTQRGLEENLVNLGVTDIILMGLSATGCVYKTAEGALTRGFNILTANTLIADEKGKESLRKGREWYSANGKFFETHGDLISYVGARV